LTPSEQRRLLRMEIATDTGWTLHYIDSLPLTDVGDYVAVRDAKQKASERRRKGKKK